MELEQEKVDLIKKVILSDKKYMDNEDLFEDFFNETYKRSFLIIKTVSNNSSLEAYLKRIATTSILNVLKDSGRVRRTQSNFVPTKEIPLEISDSETGKNYSNIQINYDIIDVDENPEDLAINKEILQTLIDAVTIAHHLNPTKQYMELYQLRYVLGLKQKQIAEELNLSQGEVSKRLLELMEEIKVAFTRA